MSNFRSLIVWQKSMALVTRIYQVTNLFPKEEVFGLTSQIRRSSISIPSNIAEGYGRSSDTELVRFLNIAVGSLFELQTQLEIARNVGYLSISEFDSAYASAREIEVMLISLVNKVKQSK